ncbi:MAG TPA: cupin domain-containing protein [Noviherbaspirillum sp.]
MSLHHAESGEVINLLPLGHELTNTVSTALFRTDQLEAMRLVLTADKEIPEHQVSGDFTLHCLEGRVELRVDARTEILQAGQMMFVAANVPYAIRALDDSSLLMTLARAQEVGGGEKNTPPTQ